MLCVKQTHPQKAACVAGDSDWAIKSLPNIKNISKYLLNYTTKMKNINAHVPERLLQNHK